MGGKNYNKKKNKKEEKEAKRNQVGETNESRPFKERKKKMIKSFCDRDPGQRFHESRSFCREKDTVRIIEIPRVYRKETISFDGWKTIIRSIARQDEPCNTRDSVCYSRRREWYFTIAFLSIYLLSFSLSLFFSVYFSVIYDLSEARMYNPRFPLCCYLFSTAPL